MPYSVRFCGAFFAPFAIPHYFSYSVDVGPNFGPCFADLVSQKSETPGRESGRLCEALPDGGRLR